MKTGLEIETTLVDSHLTSTAQVRKKKLNQEWYSLRNHCAVVELGLMSVPLTCTLFKLGDK